MFKVSHATVIDVGLVGPKARLKSVADGQLVNIPALPDDYRYGAHRFDPSAFWLYASRKGQVKPKGRSDSGSRGAEKSHAVTSSGDRTVNRHRWVGSYSAKVYERNIV